MIEATIGKEGGYSNHPADRGGPTRWGITERVARDVGALQADVRTVKRDVANISSKLDGLSLQINNFGVKQARGLGFFAGAVAAWVFLKGARG